jgi:hypothetical protein
MNESLLTPVQDGHTNPVLEMADGQFLFRMTSLAGTQIEKFVSPAAVREAFTKIPVDSEWLAPGVARWGIFRGVEWAVLFVPPRPHDLELTEYDGTPDERAGRIHVSLPGMVFFGAGSKYFAWAVKTAHLDPFQEIYRAPLPNVMPDASVCWGATKPPNASARAIAEAWNLFAYRTTFNNHAANAKSKREPEDVRRVLRACAETGEAYPTGDLVRQVGQTGVTLDAAFRGYFETGVMPG